MKQGGCEVHECLVDARVVREMILMHASVVDYCFFALVGVLVVHVAGDLLVFQLVFLIFFLLERLIPK